MNTYPAKESKIVLIRHMVIYFLLFLAGDFLGSLPFDFLFSFVTLPESWMYHIPRITGCLALTYFLFWFYTTRKLHLKMSDFRISYSVKKWAAVYALLLPAFVIGVYFIIGHFSLQHVTPAAAVLIILDSLLLALKAGILEEMLFRGYIMKTLEKGWNKYIAILLPSFLFSLAHIPQMETFSFAGILLLVISGTSVGIMFSLAAYKGNSVGNSILLHAVWNFFMVTDIFRITTPQNMYGSPLFSIIIPSDNVLLTGAGFGAEASVTAVMGYLMICCLIIYPGRKKKKSRKIQPL